MTKPNITVCYKKLIDLKPLVLSISNQVSINECANGLLALGACPIMSDDPQDAKQLAEVASATVLNIGTANEKQLEVMMASGYSAKKNKHPLIFDPVGAGATDQRLKYSSQIINELSPEIIRANFAEIKALAGLKIKQKGVDSEIDKNFEKTREVAEALALNLGSIVAVSGETDVVSDGRRSYFISGGDPLLTRLTGTGCLLSAMVAAYAGANKENLLLSTAAAMAHMAVAGSYAAKTLENRSSLGTFKVNLFNHLGSININDLENAEVWSK